MPVSGSRQIPEGMNVLVTGGGGFAGSAIVRALLRENCRVTATVSSPSKASRLSGLETRISIQPVNLSDRQAVEKLASGTDFQAVIHAAGVGSQPGGQASPGLFQAANQAMAGNLIAAFRERNLRSMILLGSSQEYGHLPRASRETDTPSPVTPFGASKLEVTRAFLAAASSRFPVTVLRIFSIYGPGEYEGRLIPRAIRTALEGGTLPFTAGDIRRDFVFAGDAAGAVIAALKRPSPAGEIFNIGTGIQTSNEEIVGLIEKLTGRTVTLQRGAYPRRPSDTDCWVSDPSKAERLLGWKAATSLETGLRETIEWIAGEKPR